MSWPPVKVHIPDAKEVLRQIVDEGRQINPKPQTAQNIVLYFDTNTGTRYLVRYRVPYQVPGTYCF